MTRLRGMVFAAVIVGSMAIAATASAQQPFVDPSQPALRQYSTGTTPPPVARGADTTPPTATTQTAASPGGVQGAGDAGDEGGSGAAPADTAGETAGSGAAPADAAGAPVQVRSPVKADPTKNLPFTGGQALLVAIIGLLLLALGTLLAAANRERQRRSGSGAPA